MTNFFASLDIAKCMHFCFLHLYCAKKLKYVILGNISVNLAKFSASHLITLVLSSSNQVYRSFSPS